jgi:SPP1 family predicted phage head-tail adaptor
MPERTAPPIGTLTERVVLKQRLTTHQDEGGEAALFSPIATVWARVRPLGARAAFASDARTQATSHVVVLRHRTDLKPGDRISWRGGDLDVEGMSNLDGRRAYLSVQCSSAAVTG